MNSQLAVSGSVIYHIFISKLGPDPQFSLMLAAKALEVVSSGWYNY